MRVGLGSPQARIGNIYHSFTEALANLERVAGPVQGRASGELHKAELLNLDPSALEDYLQFGTFDGFDDFFGTYLEPLGETALHSYFIKKLYFCGYYFDYRQVCA